MNDDMISREAAIAAKVVAWSRELWADQRAHDVAKGLATLIEDLPAAPAVKVKSLAWRPETHGINDVSITSAVCALGRYIVWNNLTLARPCCDDIGPFDSAQAAKAAAQADYEARILAALEAPHDSRE